MWLFPNILATLTRHPRQLVVAGIDFEWSQTSWTHNIFRTYELIFGRRDGIRYEGSMSKSYENGRWVTSYDFGTYENLIAHTESMIREFFKTWELGFQFAPVPQLAFAGPQMPSIFQFAIANDTSTNSYNGVEMTNPSGTITVTGTNPGLIAHARTSLAGNTCTGMSFNSVAMTEIANIFQATLRGMDVWRLTGQIGTKTLQATATQCILLDSASFSGVIQSWVGGGGGGSDASNTATTAASSDLSNAITVVRTGCWIFTCTCNDQAAISGTGSYYSGGSSASFRTASSGAVVSTGSNTIHTNPGGGAGSSIVFSFAPSANLLPSLGSG